MCELLGINSASKVYANDLLTEFYSHSKFHPNGWGLAVFHGDMAQIEKQPISAKESIYLKQRLRHKIMEKVLIAHIRLATMGSVDYENCHPFVRQDTCGRRWTLAHNGTLFHGDLVNKYFYTQEGTTDSERILFYIIDKINRDQTDLGRPLIESERFAVINEVVNTLADGNKLNILLYDGELMYVHTNYAHSLYISESDDTVLIATNPVGNQPWKELPMNTLLAFKNGRQVYSGNNHGKEYIDNEQDTKFLYLDSAWL